MAYHWTYVDFEPASDLEQGDFLSPTEALRAILRDVHPHFCDGKYIGFIVATQSCDLVRREKGAAARYISIATVRSLNQVLPTLVASVATEAVGGVFLKTSKGKAYDLLKRVVDQNEQALGLFYMHSDELLGIGDPSVAYLRVTVALRRDHYGVLLAARKGRLAPAFQAKLGWLLGNLYARPATPDWSDSDGGKAASSETIQLLLKRLHWIGEAEFEALRKAEPCLDQLPAVEVVKRASRQKVKRPIDELAEAAVDTTKRLADEWFRKRLNSFAFRLHKLEEPADADAAPRAPSDRVLALAQEVFAGVTEKEARSIADGFKSDVRAKRIADRVG